MSVEIKLTFATLELAITAMAAVRAVEGKTDKPETAKPEAAPKEVAAPATKPKAAADKPTAAPAPTAAPTPPKTESSAPSGIEYKVVGDAIKAAVTTHREQVVALLGEFKAKTGKDLKPEDYPAFTVKLGAITAPADDLA